MAVNHDPNKRNTNSKTALSRTGRLLDVLVGPTVVERVDKRREPRRVALHVALPPIDQRRWHARRLRDVLLGLRSWSENGVRRPRDCEDVTATVAAPCAAALARRGAPRLCTRCQHAEHNEPRIERAAPLVAAAVARERRRRVDRRRGPGVGGSDLTETHAAPRTRPSSTPARSICTRRPPAVGQSHRAPQALWDCPKVSFRCQHPRAADAPNTDVQRQV